MNHSKTKKIHTERDAIANYMQEAIGRRPLSSENIAVVVDIWDSEREMSFYTTTIWDSSARIKDIISFAEKNYLKPGDILNNIKIIKPLLPDEKPNGK